VGIPFGPNRDAPAHVVHLDRVAPVGSGLESKRGIAVVVQGDPHAVEHSTTVVRDQAEDPDHLLN
jgi:hypothetical protein